MENKQHWIVSIDIERTGPDLGDRILSVGIVVGTIDGDILLYSRIPIKYTFEDIKTKLWNGRLYERTCKMEFWDKLSSKIRLYSIIGSVYTEEAANKINNILDFVHTNADKNNYTLTFVSDNIDGDYSPLNHFIKKTINRVPVRWNSNSEKPIYRHIKDSWDSLGICLGGKSKKVNSMIDKYIPHNHDPLMDALKTYTEFVISKNISEFIKNFDTGKITLKNIKKQTKNFIGFFCPKIKSQVETNNYGTFIIINKNWIFSDLYLLNR